MIVSITVPLLPKYMTIIVASFDNSLFYPVRSGYDLVRKFHHTTWLSTTPLPSSPLTHSLSLLICGLSKNLIIYSLCQSHSVSSIRISRLGFDFGSVTVGIL